MTESICLIIHLDIFFWNLVQKNIDCSLCIPLAAQRITLQHITNLLAELKSAKAISWQISLFSHEQVKHQIDKTRNKTENHFLIFFISIPWIVCRKNVYNVKTAKYFLLRGCFIRIQSKWFLKWKMGWKVLLYVFIHLHRHKSTRYLWNYYTICSVNISNAPSAQYIVIPMYTTTMSAAQARWSERNFARELVSAVVLLSPYSQHL